MPGDYPQHTYQYTGTVEAENGCISSFFDVFFTFNPVPVPTITGAELVCQDSVATYSTESGMAGYSWSVSGGAITAGGTASDDTLEVTWGGWGSGSVSVDYTDPNGCTAAAATVLAVSIDDAIPPVITCPADVTVECDDSTDPGDTGSATATDNCEVAAVTYADSVGAGSCLQASIITRTWTATDGCGNSSSCAQIITVVDTTAPVITCPPDVTIECATDSSPAATGTATATTTAIRPRP